MLRHAVLFLFFTRALTETTYLDCHTVDVQKAYGLCVQQIPDSNLANCAYYSKSAACINPACCANDQTKQTITNFNSSLIENSGVYNCTMPCGSGTPPDVVDCDSTTVKNLVYNQRIKLGYEGDLTQATGCKYYQNYASVIPKACCDAPYYKSLLAFMPVALAALKVDSCSVTCGMSLSSASAPRAVFSVVVLSALVALATVIY
jgi:hypothetical protein